MDHQPLNKDRARCAELAGVLIIPIAMVRAEVVMIVFVLSMSALPPSLRGSAPSTLPATAPAERKLVLVTNSYEVTITLGGDEGNVEDNDVTYHGVSKKSGKRITLKGLTWHTHAADGTPSRFLGYRFQSGKLMYEVLEEGRLTVVRDRREVLVDESGEWQE
jgi:hypothetical protein